MRFGGLRDVKAHTALITPVGLVLPDTVTAHISCQLFCIVRLSGWPAMYAGEHSWAPIGMFFACKFDMLRVQDYGRGAQW